MKTALFALIAMASAVPIGTRLAQKTGPTLQAKAGIVGPNDDKGGLQGNLPVMAGRPPVCNALGALVSKGYKLIVSRSTAKGEEVFLLAKNYDAMVILYKGINQKVFKQFMGEVSFLPCGGKSAGFQVIARPPGGRVLLVSVLSKSLTEEEQDACSHHFESGEWVFFGSADFRQQRHADFHPLIAPRTTCDNVTTPLAEGPLRRSPFRGSFPVVVAR
jgi:hypothetical protein